MGSVKRVAALAVTSVSLLCCNQLEGVGSQEIASDLLIQVENQNADGALGVMDRLGEMIEASEDPLAESRKFLQTFLKELNAKYGLNLTLHDACRFVRDNFHALGLPEESREDILGVIALYEQEPATP